MAVYYPPVGFHFQLEVAGFPDEIGFQSISGINASVPNSESYEEGGENRFTHRLPVRSSFENLVAKRGMLVGSELIDWFKDALEDFKFDPRSITVTLLNQDHDPLESWVFTNAWPTKWNIGDFDAENGAVVVETIEFSYQYFRRSALPRQEPQNG